MKKECLTTDYTLFENEDELQESDRELVSAAEAARMKSYSPYSRFKVGAAIRTKDGTIIHGANQENAAYPSGLCAERTALFACGMQSSEPLTMAVVARNERGEAASAYPCGACRQVMSETEKRYGCKLSVIVGLKGGRYAKFSSVSALLPFEFEI